ncbi:AAA family ATPase [Staphylococcus equorum]|uniref:AAA family ATPase n=1 Tax=Staphylococcus equorum TaxID=246432 RepID=UPI0025547578|nr:AAA family ATPase [Staphylococcus equorum]MDK9844796.1 AAA family ATPase [Staphylococcus equorum]
MLINFKVKNYRSYKNQADFAMLTGKNLKKFSNNKFEIDKTVNNEGLKLLKNSIIFGSNGSGKSNLIKALKTMKDIVISNRNRTKERITRTPFLLDNNSIDNPTIFSVEFIIEGFQYLYEFSFNENEFFYEKLDYICKDEYVNYFYRSNEKKCIPKNLKEEYEKTRNNVLFLYSAQNANDNHAIRVMKWFIDKLLFIDEHLNGGEINDLQHLIKNDDTKRQIIDFLKLCDVNIVDIDTILDESHEKFKKFFKEQSKERGFSISEIYDELDKERYDLVLTYKKFDENGHMIGTENIQFFSESEGTKKLLTLVLNLFNLRNENKVVIMDEFDDSLHLNLSKILVNIFNQVKNYNQFILTSHQLNLLDCNLRIDQIYFTEKYYDGSTELYSMFDFIDDSKGSRNDISKLKRYMEGVYGAIPNVDANDFNAFKNILDFDLSYGGVTNGEE